MGKLRICLSMAVLSTAAIAPAQGSLVIRIDDLILQPGFTQATVDVWIRAASTDVLLNSFDFEFQIQPLGGTVTQLRFLDPQGDLQLADSRYVFAGGSVRRDGFMFIVPQPVGQVSGVDSPFDTFIGGDISTVPGLLGDVTVTSDLTLLARLQLVPATGTSAPTLGDQFTIRLIDGENTDFQNSSGILGYTSFAGTVSIAAQPEAMVPEPSSLLMWVLISSALVGGGRLRRRWGRSASGSAAIASNTEQMVGV